MTDQERIAQLESQMAELHELIREWMLIGEILTAQAEATVH